MVEPDAESSYMLHVWEKSKMNLAASRPQSLMRFFVRYLSVYLGKVSHYGNLLSKVQKLKMAIFGLLVFFWQHGNQNSVEQKRFGMTCPSNVCLT